MTRPDCQQVAEVLGPFVEAQRRGECVHSDILDQADGMIHALLEPPSNAEIVELAALGSAVGQGMLKSLGRANAVRN